ncbi:MAG: tetratricopeptide repeat protein [Planctomycetota bacterium]|nr:tetratricopeptide repeat protein [Planctomycetota bacterium]
MRDPSRLRQFVLPSALPIALLGGALFSTAGCETTRGTPSIVLQERGDHEFEWGRYDSAIGFYRQILDREPGDADALEMYGRCLLELGKPVEAAESLSIAVARRPGERDLLFLLAEAEFQAGDVDEAFDLVRTWALDNNDAGAWFTLADFSRRSSDPDTARDAVVRAIEIDPDGSVEYYLLAAEIDIELLQNTSSALRRLRQAYGLAPDDPRVSDRIRAYGEIPGPTLVLPPGP